MLEAKQVGYTISKRFELRDINFSIPKGASIAIIGESGCGKTSLLKLLYGLYDANKGSIYWKDQKITGPKDHLIPGMPFMKYLSQDFDLMPFTSVVENVQKHLSRLEPEHSAQRTAELLEVVEMTAFAKAHVKTLSGGQKQRVALAQTLAKAPEVLLLDEPFSHIDNFRKNKLRRRLFDYLKKAEITCLVATHDSTDVLAYTDETIVMRHGQICAHAPTPRLYQNPPNYYIASLFGDVNELPAHWFDTSASPEQQVLIYPHQIGVSTTGFAAQVVGSYFMGSQYLIEASYKEKTIFFESERDFAAQEAVILGRIKN
ncbi:MAG: ABC transporter ATP-binding protein [Dokdonia sp.]|jgi:ABC-type Fe3+/spermidine/putrescine transport system ATPase subunit